MKDHQKDAWASKEEMTRFVSASATGTPLKNAQCGQWLVEEELYVPWVMHPTEKDLETRDDHVAAIATSVALLGALASTTLLTITACRSLRKTASTSRKLISA